MLSSAIDRSIMPSALALDGSFPRVERDEREADNYIVYPGVAFAVC